ncbi:MAG: hypothetical protein IJ309_00560 [Clostridia bacterium]|nr:hypothetical protein [Clostridia bacterium]
MKYVSPKYEYQVFTSEDIMLFSDLSDIFNVTENPETPENDVSVSVGVGDLMP